MAIYRNVQLSFWTDSKVSDDFTPSDRYVFLYLITNPHTSISGCYEISKRQMSAETGYSEEKITTVLKRLENEHRVTRYDGRSSEVLILNWGRYNWNSPKVAAAVRKQAKGIKNKDFQKYVLDTLSVRYPYPIDITDTDTVSDSVSDKKKSKGEKETRSPTSWRDGPTYFPELAEGEKPNPKQKERKPEKPVSWRDGPTYLPEWATVDK